MCRKSAHALVVQLFRLIDCCRGRSLDPGNLSVRLLAPVPTPTQIRDCAAYDQQDAGSYIFGYTIFNRYQG